MPERPRGACPVVGSFGARDVGGTKPKERLERALTVLEIPHDVQVYPGSGHRFMSESSGASAILARFARMSYQEADGPTRGGASTHSSASTSAATAGARHRPRTGLHEVQLHAPSLREIAPEESTLIIPPPAWDCIWD